MDVKVPKEVANSLSEDGFRMAGAERGVELYVETILAASANLVTVFADRHEIARFIERLFSPLRGRSRAPRRMRIGFTGGGPAPELVLGMTALLEALAEPRDRRSAVH